MLSEEDASLVVRYMEDANERKIMKTVENKIEHLATKEDIANIRTELKGDISNLRAEMKEDGTKQIKRYLYFGLGK